MASSSFFFIQSKGCRCYWYSTGIGHETSLILARKGFLTYATMRNLNRSESIKSIATKENLPIHIKQLDVTDDASVKNAVEAISSETGRLDILVNKAGYGLNGAFEDLAMDEIKAQFETNVFGLIRTTQAVLPIMRRQKYGTIINIALALEDLVFLEARLMLAQNLQLKD